jgi:hypothetical protein
MKTLNSPKHQEINRRRVRRSITVSAGVEAEA